MQRGVPLGTELGGRQAHGRAHRPVKADLFDLVGADREGEWQRRGLQVGRGGEVAASLAQVREQGDQSMLGGEGGSQGLKSVQGQFFVRS